MPNGGMGDLGWEGGECGRAELRRGMGGAEGACCVGEAGSTTCPDNRWEELRRGRVGRGEGGEGGASGSGGVKIFWRPVNENLIPKGGRGGEGRGEEVSALEVFGERPSVWTPTPKSSASFTVCLWVHRSYPRK